MYRMLFALFIAVLSSQIGFAQTPPSLSSAGFVMPTQDDPPKDGQVAGPLHLTLAGQRRSGTVGGGAD